MRAAVEFAAPLTCDRSQADDVSQRIARIEGSTNWLMRKVPRILIAWTASYSSRLTSAMRVPRATAALLINTSTLPKILST